MFPVPVTDIARAAEDAQTFGFVLQVAVKVSILKRLTNRKYRNYKIAKLPNKGEMLLRKDNLLWGACRKEEAQFFINQLNTAGLNVMLIDENMNETWFMAPQALPADLLQKIRDDQR